MDKSELKATRIKDESTAPSSHFEDEYYEILERMEQEHFWYWGRYRLISRLLEENIREREMPPRLSGIDLGCGTGGWLQRLTRNKSLEWQRLAGGDCSAKSLQRCSNKLPQHVELHRCDLNDLRYDNEWDIVFLLDSLEYSENDLQTLRSAGNGLRTGGLAIISVPAYNWMWSQTDVMNGNQRRYNKNELSRLCAAAGLNAVSITGFNAFLIPLYLLSRITLGKPRDISTLNAQQKSEILEKNHRTPPDIVNKALKLLMRLELKIGRIRRIPFGTSFILVASK